MKTEALIVALGGLLLAFPVVATAAAVPATAPSVRSFPEVGVEAEVEIGQAMVLRESIVTATSLRLLEQVRSERFGLGARVTLRPGVYRLDRASDRGRYYAAPGRTAVGPLASFPVEGIFVPEDSSQPPMAYQQALLATARVKVPEMKIEAADQSGFRRELVYGGVAQGVVSVAYREFNNDFARPAFSQDLRYDLSAGREIGFRGARIEILQAGNTSVKFKLLKPLDAAGAAPSN